jgi:transcription initiation factor IIE alpha subunit
MNPATVEAASRQLEANGLVWVTYTCQFSGKEESVLLIGDAIATEVTKSLPGVDDLNGTKILAGLYSAELCECDVATLTGIDENDVVSLLQQLSALGMIAHRRIQEMNYYRLNSRTARQSIKDAIDVKRKA